MAGTDERRGAASRPAAMTAEDAAKQASLNRIKAIATGALVACIAVYAVATIFKSQYPALAFVAAFAEAAAIGGIADWYAVVALFRRPLGLPIPHTAIIPANQSRIADNLGRFIEVNFLASGPVRDKLGEVDFAALVADWLSEPRRAEALSGFVGKLVPQAVKAIGDSGLKDFAGQRFAEQIDKVKIAPLAADLLASFTHDRRHQRLFDELIRTLGKLLNDEQALAMMRDRIRDELPSLARFFRADAYLLKRIVSSAGSLLEEVRADPDHPLRAEFDGFVAGFIDKLRQSPDYAERAEKLKRDFLARPELANMVASMWESLGAFVEQDAQSPDSAIRSHLAGLFVDIGRQLSEDPQVRADMNQGFVVALAAFVERQKSGVSAFIADQVKGWDLGQLTHLVELNVGRDLQYIRFNGMIIGGIAGLLLHTGSVLLLGE
ncbi:DUF445 family protein [Aquibium sp. ELW1220]|uniref:DUF445 domain-containing protein n=1 Tax=Aquibium sp. ELW1220 TaxID=2976766 RepID=UPI0025B0AA27|nr:DUF445 family protein [Aquibium sp. ELW1220]MDN2578643.1 DUF445 family protein [Aquibium sp. ELW1220]